LERSEVVEVQSSLVGGKQVEVGHGDARGEALALLELMSSSGVLDSEVVSNILDNVDSSEVVEAEVVDESEDRDV